MPEGISRGWDLAANGETPPVTAVSGGSPPSPITITITEGVLRGHAAIGGLSKLDAFGDPIIAQLRDLQRLRRFCIGMQSRINRSTQSYVAGTLGAHSLPAGERKKVFARAAQVIRAIEKGESSSFEDAGIVTAAALSRHSWDTMRGDAENRMRGLAKKLPAWPFVKGVLGVKELGLAVIVAEAGDPTAYRDKHTLCKRLGLGVIDGLRQGRPGKSATADDWIRHGYSKIRRADVWVFLSDAMLRAQWQPKKGKIGPYGAIYSRQKDIYLARGWEKAHADAGARRYASKAFIRDLRNAWREAAE